MKKTIFILTFLFFTLPAFSFDEMSNYSIEEYSRLFEMGLNDGMEEDFPLPERNVDEEEFRPKLKEKLDTKDAINLEPYDTLKLKIEKQTFFDSYKEIYKKPETKNELIKTEKFTFFSDGKKELSDYMTDNFKSTLNASYDFSEQISLRAGQEVWYVNQDARVGAKKFYFNPRLKLNKEFYLDYVGKYNEQNKYIEQEVGLNYKPSLFKDAASFGIKATATINDNNQIQSKKLKFSSDIYLF